MPVFRTEKVSDYAVIAKHHLKNKSLSYKAKGLMTFMLSVPDGWDYSLAGLATLASDGIDGVRSGVRELEKHGYLTRCRIRDASGRLGDIEYTIHEIPQAPLGTDPTKPPRGSPPAPISQKPMLENPTLVTPVSDLPILDYPMQVLPTQAIPMQENPMQCINNKSNIKGLSNKGLSNNNAPCLSVEMPTHSEAIDPRQLTLGMDSGDNTNSQAECLKVQTAQGLEDTHNHTMTLVKELLDQQFDVFWGIYPRKVSKKAAKKAWSDIKPDNKLFTTIINSLKIANAYWQHQAISLKHIPYPSTWLNEERWEDEFLPEQLIGVPSYQARENINTRQGGGEYSAHGADYKIGGTGDPYKSLISG